MANIKNIDFTYESIWYILRKYQKGISDNGRNKEDKLRFIMKWDCLVADRFIISAKKENVNYGKSSCRR